MAEYDLTLNTEFASLSTCAIYALKLPLALESFSKSLTKRHYVNAKNLWFCTMLCICVSAHIYMPGVSCI